MGRRISIVKWEAGTRVRIKKHDNVVMLLWGKMATILGEAQPDYLFGVGIYHLVRADDGSKITLWGDQFEVDVLGELAEI